MPAVSLGGHYLAFQHVDCCRPLCSGPPLKLVIVVWAGGQCGMHVTLMHTLCASRNFINRARELSQGGCEQCTCFLGTTAAVAARCLACYSLPRQYCRHGVPACVLLETATGCLPVSGNGQWLPLDSALFRSRCGRVALAYAAQV